MLIFGSRRLMIKKENERGKKNKYREQKKVGEILFDSKSRRESMRKFHACLRSLHKFLIDVCEKDFKSLVSKFAVGYEFMCEKYMMHFLLHHHHHHHCLSCGDATCMIKFNMKFMHKFAHHGKMWEAKLFISNQEKLCSVFACACRVGWRVHGVVK